MSECVNFDKNQWNKKHDWINLKTLEGFIGPESAIGSMQVDPACAEAHCALHGQGSTHMNPTAESGRDPAERTPQMDSSAHREPQ